MFFYQPSLWAELKRDHRGDDLRLYVEDIHTKARKQPWNKLNEWIQMVLNKIIYLLMIKEKRFIHS